VLKIDSALVYKINKLVDYQEGSIVSREIISKSSGTITAFAFDAGQSLSAHKAPFDALVHILDGQAEVVIGDENFELVSGEMIVLPIDIMHSLKAIQRFKMLLIMIR
jgi:quercetin dioxygenase-like cupin family protein